MRGKSRRSDYLLSLSVFSLVIFGVVMISSASVVLSYDKFSINNYYLIRHIISAAIGTAALIIFSLIDYKFWKRISPILMLSTIILLFLVFLFGFQSGGAQRWLNLGFTTVQPTELAKLVYVLYLAAWLEGRKDKIKDFQYGFLPFVAMTGFIAVLILFQPDFGTASVILVTAAFMFVAAGASFEQMILGGTSAVLLGWFLIKSSSYRFARLTVFLDPSSDSQGIGYHINQALLAIGSGGIIGLGFGMSRQKYHYLPEPMGDSIFAIVAEEMGFVRTLLVILLFVVLVVRGYKIARNSPDLFARFTAFGITTWLSVQATINIAAMLSLVPLTGVPLPFMSYGGSALVTSMAAVGILLNISKNSSGESFYESSNRGRRNRRTYNSRSLRRRSVKRKRR